MTGLRTLHQSPSASDAAFDLVMDRYQGRLRRYIRGRVGPREDVDDLLQEILIKVWNGLPTVRGTNASSTSAWVFAIARNTVAQHYRQQCRVSVGPLEEADGSFEFETALVSATAIEAELGKVPAAERAVIELRLLMGMSSLEAADRLGRSVPMIKTLQHRGLVRLRHLMAEHE